MERRILPVKLDKYRWALFALIALITISNFIWLKLNKTPPSGNGLQDLFPGINFYLDIIEGRINLSKLLTIFNPPILIKSLFLYIPAYLHNNFHLYPPLVSLSYAVFYFFFQPGSGLELMANTLYLAIALLSIYGIGKRMYNPKVGLFAAFIFSSFLGVIIISRKVYVEFHVMCLVALTIYVLLMTDYFRNRKNSFFLGICLGLVALAKWEFVATLIGPFILMLWKSNSLVKEYRLQAQAKTTLWVNLFIAISIGALIASIWYVPSFKDIFWRLFIRPDENIFQNNRTTFDTQPFSLRTVTYYPLIVINSFIGFFYSLCLVFLGIFFLYLIFKNKQLYLGLGKDKFYMWLFLLWIIIPYPCFTLVKIQAASHIMAVLPPIAIIIAGGILSLKNKLIRVTFISLVIFYGCLAHLHSFLVFGKLESIFNLKVVIDRTNRLKFTTFCSEQTRDCWENNSFNPPETRDWKIKEALSFIREDSQSMKSKPTVFVLGGWRQIDKFNFPSFQYYNLLGNYNLYIEPRSHDRSERPEDRSHFDYVVIFIPQEEANNKLARIIQSTHNIIPEYNVDNFQKNFFKSYHLIKKYNLPDNAVAKVYKLTDNQ